MKDCQLQLNNLDQSIASLYRASAMNVWTEPERHADSNVLRVRKAFDSEFCKKGVYQLGIGCMVNMLSLSVSIILSSDYDDESYKS